MSWQSIESAPKDGTEILVYRDGVHHVLWHNLDWCDPTHSWSFTKEAPPTHWMPLPDPPQH
jgi:hypothetical protein